MILLFPLSFFIVPIVFSHCSHCPWQILAIRCQYCLLSFACILLLFWKLNSPQRCIMSFYTLVNLMKQVKFCVGVTYTLNTPGSNHFIGTLHYNIISYEWGRGGGTNMSHWTSTSTQLWLIIFKSSEFPLKYVYEYASFSMLHVNLIRL